MSFENVDLLVGEWSPYVDVRVLEQGGHAMIVLAVHPDDPTDGQPAALSMSIREAVRMATLLTEAVSLVQHLKTGWSPYERDEDALAELNNKTLRSAQ